jgi:hypothetical protein
MAKKIAALTLAMAMGILVFSGDRAAAGPAACPHSRFYIGCFPRHVAAWDAFHPQYHRHR